MRLWIKDPIAVLAHGAERGLVVEDGRIAALVPAGDHNRNADDVFDAGRHVILPGLINTHHHFYQTLTRAHPDAINKELFPWLKALYPIWARLTPEAFPPRDPRRAGRTHAVGLHDQFRPPVLSSRKGSRTPSTSRPRRRCALGMRMTLNRGAMNLSQKDGGLPPDSVVQDHDTILADCERVAGKYHDASEGAMLQVAIAPCSPFSVTRELMRDTRSIAAKCGCRLHTHLAETHDEDAFCLETFGCRPVDYLEEAGWLNDRLVARSRRPFRRRRDRTAGQGRRRRLALPGLQHDPRLRPVPHAGPGGGRRSLGLGVDGSASNCNSNMIDGVRQALLLNRLRYGAAAVTHLDVLRWASEARHAASAAPTSARSPRASRPTSPSSHWTSCAFPAPPTRSRPSSCAARKRPTGS